LHTKKDVIGLLNAGMVLCGSLLGGLLAGFTLDYCTPTQDTEGDLLTGSIVFAHRVCRSKVAARVAFALACPATLCGIGSMLVADLPSFAVMHVFLLTLAMAEVPVLNIALMEACEMHLRPLAVALQMIAFHAFGDLFSPTIVGLFKDVSSLRAGLIFAIAWLTWNVVFTALASTGTRLSRSWKPSNAIH